MTSAYYSFLYFAGKNLVIVHSVIRGWWKLSTMSSSSQRLEQPSKDIKLKVPETTEEQLKVKDVITPEDVLGLKSITQGESTTILVLRLQICSTHLIFFRFSLHRRR